LLKDFRLVPLDASHNRFIWFPDFLGSNTNNTSAMATSSAHSSVISGGIASAGASASGKVYGETVSSEAKLSYREFLKCLLKVAEEKNPSAGLAENMRHLIEDMDVSEQALVLERSGLLEEPLKGFYWKPEVLDGTDNT
jgi:hypothetical protein